MTTDSKKPLCSIIVPVFNHWHLVPRLIEGIIDQTLGTDELELLLVDNGSDNLPDQPDFPPFARILHCAEPGSYAARNEGIKHATGEFLAFTDADCEPAPTWLKSALDYANEHENPKSVIIAGALNIIAAEGKDPNPCELYEMVLGLPQERYVQRGYGTTANLVFAKQVIDATGPFDATRFSGGDAEFCRRAAHHGIVTRYCHEAVVNHPARSTWEALAGKVRRIKGGQITAGPYQRRFLWTVRTLLPPVRAWRMILNSTRLQTGRQRMVLCHIQFRLWIVEIGELARLLAGRKPARS